MTAPLSTFVSPSALQGEFPSRFALSPFLSSSSTGTPSLWSAAAAVRLADRCTARIHTSSLINAGAVSIHRLEPPGAAGGAKNPPLVEQLVFIVGSELDVVRPTILEVLGQSKPSQTARIFCGLTEEEQRRVSPSAPGYQQLRLECLERLQDAGADAAVSVAPVWLGPTVRPSPPPPPLCGWVCVGGDLSRRCPTSPPHPR